MRKRLKIIIIIIGSMIFGGALMFSILDESRIPEPEENTWPFPCIPNFDNTNNIAEPHPFTFTEEDLILRADDFFYTYKGRDFTLKLGMDRKEALDLAGRVTRRVFDPREDQHEIVCGIIERQYIFREQILGFENEYLHGILTEDDHSGNDNWEIYGGITAYTSKADIIEILGEPTIGEDNSLTYMFFRTAEGKYQKIRTMEEVRWFATIREYAINLRVIEFWGVESTARSSGLSMVILGEADYVQEGQWFTMRGMWFYRADVYDREF